MGAANGGAVPAEPAPAVDSANDLLRKDAPTSADGAAPGLCSDMEQDYSISWTIEHLHLYNPDFQLTPEVISLLRRFFEQLDPDNRGVISSSVLVEKIRQVDPTELHFTTDQLNQLNIEKLRRRESTGENDVEPDDVTFDEFCALVMRWKEISPVGVQMVYTTWVKEMGAVEFGLVNETDGMFILQLPPSPSGTTTDTSGGPPPAKSSTTTSPFTLFSGATSTELRSFLAGGAAGIIAKSTLSPIDRVKLLFQVSDHLRFTLRNALSMGVDIAQRDGLLALFRGNTLNLVRVFMSAGIQHSTFDIVRRRFHDYNQSQHDRHTPSAPYIKTLSNMQLLLSGSIAGPLSCPS
ncbi:hypothetical protein AC1031_001374 [Aphanomyces cochlioides]|nr:hypothetical protein AC1031_001374 [Aphanomyces cochlioides]